MQRTEDAGTVKQEVRDVTGFLSLKLDKNCRAYRLFKESCNEQSTLETYEKGLQYFCKFTDLNLTDVVSLESDELQLLLENWVMSMSDRGLRATAKKSYLNGVEKFLDVNRKLYHKKILRGLIKPDKQAAGGGKPFTDDDIYKMIRAADKPRTRALVLFFVSSGGRDGAITDPPLRMKHIHIQYDESGRDTGCYAIRVYDNDPSGYSENSKDGYWIFMTPESRKAIDDYIRSRKLNGEIIDQESPLFATKNKSKKHDYVTVNTLRDTLTDLYKKAGIERKKFGNRYDKAVVYGFRKRFNTILKIDSEVNSNIAEKLMAHTRGLDGTYLKPTREQCFAEFAKAIPNLTVDSTERQKLVISAKNKEISDLKAERELNESMLRWFQRYKETHPEEFQESKSLI